MPSRSRLCNASRSRFATRSTRNPRTPLVCSPRCSAASPRGGARRSEASTVEVYKVCRTRDERIVVAHADHGGSAPRPVEEDEVGSARESLGEEGSLPLTARQRDEGTPSERRDVQAGHREFDGRASRRRDSREGARAPRAHGDHLAHRQGQTIGHSGALGNGGAGASAHVDAFRRRWSHTGSARRPPRGRRDPRRAARPRHQSPRVRVCRRPLRHPSGRGGHPRRNDPGRPQREQPRGPRRGDRRGRGADDLRRVVVARWTRAGARGRRDCRTHRVRRWCRDCRPRRERPGRVRRMRIDTSRDAHRPGCPAPGAMAARWGNEG